MDSVYMSGVVRSDGDGLEAMKGLQGEVLFGPCPGLIADTDEIRGSW